VRSGLGSLRARLFVALAFAMLFGAFATGIFAVLVDASTIGFLARLVRVVPKALALAVLFVPFAALAAALVGGRLARPIEDLTLAATRIAEGERAMRLPRGDGDETKRLARALVCMRRELEGKPYAAAFLRDAWHDLKTPVAALRATLEILDDDAFDDPIAARRFVVNMRRSTERLDRTLADLVTLARYETASIASEEPLRIGEVVAGAVERIAPLAAASRVELRTDTTADDRLRGDRLAIERALANLLENAVVATPGGRVAVDVERNAATVVVEVANEPAEIPQHARRALFDRAPKSRDGRSSGLGLAIVRAAVEAHGGTIRFVEMGPPRVRVRVELPR
jgi:signal transduction histidine kinase